MRYANTAQMVREFLEGPLTRPGLMHWRRQHFLSADGASFYFGVFDSFASARRWLPPSPEFNADALQKEYVEVRTRRIFAYDYPVMWWLSAAFRDGAQSILDIGGSVGVHYYAYLPFVDMPETLSWNVVEVPSVVAIGRTLAAVRKAPALEFSPNLTESVSRVRADVLLSAGALQYVDNGGPANLIERMARRPLRVLLNKLPLYDGEDFVTTQNLGSGCFAPVRVFNRRNFISSIEAQGYVLRDEWSVHERALYLPGFPERSFSYFTGLYFCAEERPGHGCEVDDEARGPSQVTSEVGVLASALTLPSWEGRHSTH
ncbi:methyltransferase, TIGR04325 family [Variovorax sp. GT1P44]|uniref:methyltransferase, TIGR04325 family n=1 Tax=Variovorax sp. GT1P44 TaxID=3443742 RepID=UPI003F467C75